MRNHHLNEAAFDFCELAVLMNIKENPGPISSGLSTLWRY